MPELPILFATKDVTSCTKEQLINLPIHDLIKIMDKNVLMGNKNICSSMVSVKPSVQALQSHAGHCQSKIHAKASKSAK